jgi:hypothetical protein
MIKLARDLEVTPSSLQREPESLVAFGFLLRHQDGRRVCFKANTESPSFPELRGLVEKGAGIYSGGQSCDIGLMVVGTFGTRAGNFSHTMADARREGHFN